MGTDGSVTIFDIKNYSFSRSCCQMFCLLETKNLFQLLLVMPATNASAKRFFSALKWVKSSWHSTMTQKHLNPLIFLLVCKEKTDALDHKVFLNEFVEFSDHCSCVFAKYWLNIHILVIYNLFCDCYHFIIISKMYLFNTLSTISSGNTYIIISPTSKPHPHSDHTLQNCLALQKNKTSWLS